MEPVFKTCPHCGTEGILIMANGKCPHCKKSILENEEQLIDSKNTLMGKERSSLQSDHSRAGDSPSQSVSQPPEEEVSTDASDRSSEPKINQNAGYADSGEIQPPLELVASSEVKPSPEKPSAPAYVEGKYTSSNHIKQHVNHFVNELEKKEKRYEKFSTYIGIVVFSLSIFILVFLFGFHLDDWKVWLVVFCFFVGISFAIGYTIFWICCCPVVRQISKSYKNEFSSQDIRGEADKILYRTIRNIETLPRLKRLTRVITSRFVCSACGKTARLNEAGNIANCSICKSLLVLPYPYPICPFCGKKKAIMVTPEEQVAPIRNHQGVVAGSLKYGPAGILAGGIMDAIYRPFKLAFRSFTVSTKRHSYECKACYKKWAIPLKVANAKKH